MSAQRLTMVAGVTVGLIVALVLALVLLGKAAHYVRVFDLGEFIAFEGGGQVIMVALDVEVRKITPRVPRS